MFRIVLGGVVAGLLIYVWGMVSWMVLGLHDASMHHAKNDETLAAAIRNSIDKTGVYMVPFPPADLMTGVESESAKKWMEQHKTTTVATVFATSPGGEIMPPEVLLRGLGLDVAAGLVAATLLSMAVRPGFGFVSRVVFVTLMGVFATLLTEWKSWNWLPAPTDWIVAMSVDTVVSSFLAALALAVIIRPRPAG
jgi:hypothetical protein